MHQRMEKPGGARRRRNQENPQKWHPSARMPPVALKALYFSHMWVNCARMPQAARKALYFSHMPVIWEGIIFLNIIAKTKFGNIDGRSTRSLPDSIV